MYIYESNVNTNSRTSCIYNLSERLSQESPTVPYVVCSAAQSLEMVLSFDGG